MKTKSIFILNILFLTLVLPTSSFAAQTTILPSNMNGSFCSDFTKNLRFGMRDSKDPKSNPEILKLQYALTKEGFSIRQEQFGTFGVDTLLAVIGFQEKYKDEILTSGNFRKSDGQVGPITRKKLVSLYGCKNKTVSQSAKTAPIVLTVKGIFLDEKGISITFCNMSSEDIPIFPVRVRLNGIIREFDIKSVHVKNTCYPAWWSYNTWGLPYIPNIIYSAVVSIDPFGYYKKGALIYPDLENIIIPAVEGVHVGVRNLMFKNDALQATFCNVGTQDITNFPVNITLNEVEKDFDLPELYKSGQCYSFNWKFDVWGIKYIPDTIYTVVVIVGKDFGSENPEQKFLNEFSNAAIISGRL